MGSATAGTEDAPLIADRGKPPRSSRAVVALALGALAVVGGAGAAAIARVGAAAPAPLGERAANPAARWARAPRTRTSGSPLARLRPGEDLWDMIDRGLTETRRENRGGRDFDPDLDDARVAARRDEEKIRARLGVARLSHLGAHSDDEETADDFGRRVSNQERREAKEAFEEWKLENDVDGELAGDPSKSSRAQIRKEERVAARRDEHADDRARRVAERRRVRREDRVEEKGFARRKDRFSKLRDEREAGGASAAAALSEADDEVDAETAVLQSVDAGLLEGDAAESAAAAEDAAADFIAAAAAADAADEKAADEKADSLPAAERREARVTARQERATAEEIAALEARVAADEDENDADEEAKDAEALRRAEASRKKRDAKERASSVADAARIEAQQEATEDALAAAIDGASVDDADSEESDVSALAGLQKRLRVVKRQKARAIEEAQQEAADDEADDEDSGSESYMGAFGRLGEEKGDEEEAAAPEPQPHGMYEFVEVPVNAHELEEGLQKMKEAREKYDGDAQMDEEAFEVAVSTAKSREREYAEAAAENYAEAHGLSSEEKIEKLEAERIDIERKQERTRAEINAQREELARGMREMGVTQLPDVAEAETQQLEEDTAEAEKLEEEDDEESEGEGDSYAAAALGSARTDAAEEDDEDSLPTNPLQLGWEIDELEKTKEKVLPRSSRGALGEEEVDEEAFEVAVDTAKSRVREYTEAAAEAYAEANGLSSPSEESIEDLEAEAAELDAEHERIDAEIAEEKKDLVEHLHDEGVWEEPEPGRAETEKLEEETHEKEQALKERIAEEHAHWHPWDEVEVFEKAWDGKTGEEEATSDLGLDAAEEDDEDSLPTNPLQLGWEIDELEKTKEKVLPRSSRGALGEEEVDEEAFEVAVDTAKSRVREYTEAAAEAYAEANGLSSPSEESIEDLEAEAAELDAEHERIDAEIAEEKKDLVEHLHDEGVWEEPEPGRAETEKLEEETHEKEQALKERIAEEHAHWHPWDEVEVFEKAWDGKTGEEEATSDLGLDAAEEDDEDSLPTNPLQLGWEIDELEKTKEKVLPRSSRGALGEEEVDEEAFEVAADTAKSRVREYTEAAAEAYAEANGLSSPSEESIEDLEAEAAELDAEHERIDAEIAEEKKDLVEHLHDEGVWEEPEPGRAETEKLEEETHEKEQALKERIAEEHAHWHPWDEVEVFEKAWDGKTGEEEATSDLGLDAAEEDDEDSLPTNPLQLGWEIDELEKTKEKVLPRSSRGALDFGTGPLSALEDILGASLDASDPETARPGRAARTTPRREHAPARRARRRALTRLARRRRRRRLPRRFRKNRASTSSATPPARSPVCSSTSSRTPRLRLSCARAPTSARRLAVRSRRTSAW